MPASPPSSARKTIDIRPPLWLPPLVALIAGSCYIGGKLVETRTHVGATISVAGEGKVYASPDLAMLSFGVQTGRQPSATAATQILEKTMAKIIETIQEVGVAEKDIQTESLNLYPAFDWKEGEQIPRGFEATQNLRVKVRNIDDVGTVLSSATRSGANQVSGVQFTVDEPEELRADARAKAIADAKKKARVLAKDLGVRLTRLQGFSEGGAGYPPMPMMERAMMDGMGGGGHLPVPAGEQELRVNVTLTYEVR